MAMIALTGVVVAISALFSGALERRGVSLVIVFLALGLVVGPYALNLANFEFSSPLLRVAAMVSLTMVLFSDAVSVRPRELRAHARLAAIILGPGTLATAAIVGFAAYWLLNVDATGSAILGAALASTDPVLLRSVLRDPKVSPDVRQTLRLESGLNDAVLLPIVLIAMSIAMRGRESTNNLAWPLLNLLAIGPVAGFLIGLGLVTALEQVRKRVGVRRDYESLYTLAIALTAFAVAEAIHASGYLAAFTAGLAVALRDVELCDCFHDYGEATAEMALVLTFVALGGSLIWSGLELLDARSVLFVLIALAARPLVLMTVMPRRGRSRRDRALVAWFGPRGLSTLLLVLVPIFAGMPGAEQLFAIASLVVLVSVVVHGVTPALITSGARVTDNVRITLEDFRAKQAAGEPVYLFDVRTDANFAQSSEMAAGALRVPANRAVDEARLLGIPREAWIGLYCACSGEQTSSRAALELQQAGWSNARGIIGGWDAWRDAGLPLQSAETARNVLVPLLDHNPHRIASA